MKLNVTICGMLHFKVTILKDDLDMMRVPGCFITCKDATSELTISGCAKKNTGKYNIIAKNQPGESEVGTEVVGIDKPYACTGPIRFITIANDRITLCWE